MNLCVFCGSSEGSKPSYRAAANHLGAVLAERGIGLVYGGASVGLMGAVADAVLAKGGTAVGVLPENLARVEIAHQGLTELHIVPNMHERKAKMAQLADGFILLPGGIGSLEEMFEIWTWSQLGLHQKPIGMLNVDGFYTGLQTFLDQLVTEAFVKPVHRQTLQSAAEPHELIDQMLKAKPPPTGKWIPDAKR